MTGLRGRARAAGATAGQLEAVAESEDPRGALVSLVLQLEPDPADLDEGLLSFLLPHPRVYRYVL